MNDTTNILTQKDQLDYKNLPDVEELPVLPDMRTNMDVDLAVTANGKVYVFHDKANPEEIEYASYDAEDSTLTFCSPNGRIQNIGMIVQAPMQPHIEIATNIYFIHMDNGQPKQILDLPLIISKVY